METDVQLNEPDNINFLATWIGPSAPAAAIEMMRERMIHWHPGEDWSAIPHETLMKHLEVIEWAYSQGARPGHP